VGSELPCLETERLRLRPFTLADLDAHGRLYADPEVTRYLAGGPYLGPDARLRSERAVRRFVDHWRARGFGVWALLDRTTEAFVGQCGLNTVDSTGEVEVLWALDRPAWGRGLATEAARAALDWGLEVAGVPAVIAIAAPANLASQRVMEKIGMRCTGRAQYFGLEVVRYEHARR
jgi:ribosomal-protein-alanine N-acetyltransferase